MYSFLKTCGFYVNIKDANIYLVLTILNWLLVIFSQNILTNFKLTGNVIGNLKNYVINKKEEVSE